MVLNPIVGDTSVFENMGNMQENSVPDFMSGCKSNQDKLPFQLSSSENEPPVAHMARDFSRKQF